MIEKELVKNLLTEKIGGTELFIVEVSVNAGNDIQVLIDSKDGVSIDTCVEISKFLFKFFGIILISKFLNERIDLEEENYSLEVSSPGLGSPFKVMQQYEKNVGREVEVLLSDGMKKKGKLLGLSEEMIMLEVMEKSPSPGSTGKAKPIPVKMEIAYNEIKSTKAVISFK